MLVRFGAAQIAAFVLLALVAGAARADDVTLTSRDGSVEVTGTLIGYDGEFYRIRSIYGDLTLDGSSVECTGPACPDLSDYVAEITVAAVEIIGSRILPGLLAAFAGAEGYEMSVIPAARGARFELSDPETERTAAQISPIYVSNAESFARLIAGQANMVMVSRAVLPGEAELAADAGLGTLTSPAQGQVVALDAIVPVVSERNNLRAISLDDLARLLAGDISNWQDLGGADAPVILYLARDDDVPRALILERLLLPHGQAISVPASIVDTPAQLAEAVAGDPFGLGLARLSALGVTRALDLTGACGFLSRADAASLKTEDYPITAPVYIYTGDGLAPKVMREFWHFVTSPAAQMAISRSGFVDQGFDLIGLAQQGDRLANAIRHAQNVRDLSKLHDLVDEMEGESRLSVTFRFVDGSAKLDAQSASNVTLLARTLESGAIAAKSLRFVGFSDGRGSAANAAVSLQLGEEVRTAVMREAPTFDPDSLGVEVLGLGAIMPLACGDAAWARGLNRRVEVWVK